MSPMPQSKKQPAAKCGFMILTPSALHNGGMWCAEEYPCKTHGKWHENQVTSTTTSTPAMSNPTTEPKQTWETRFRSLKLCRCKNGKPCGDTIFVIESFIREEIKAEREQGKEIAYKNVGGWHKLPLLNSDHQGRCPTCGHAGIYVRGKYPHYDNREICPLCAFEALENILDSCNSRQSEQALEESTL